MSATVSGLAFEHRAEVFDTPGEPIQLGNDNRFDLFGFDHRKQPLQARAVDALGGFATVDDHFQEL